MHGQFLGTSVLQTRVYYGPPTAPTLYECKILSASPNGSRITCQTGHGVGANLRFTVVVAGAASQQGADMYHYPPPEIYPNTLRFGLKGVGTSALQSNTTSSELIAFDGKVSICAPFVDFLSSCCCARTCRTLATTSSRSRSRTRTALIRVHALCLMEQMILPSCVARSPGLVKASSSPCTLAPERVFRMLPEPTRSVTLWSPRFTQLRDALTRVS